MKHHTKDKGDLAVAKTVADLTEKGYSVLLPVSEHLPFDLIGYKDKKSTRFQVKYTAKGNADAVTNWSDKTGIHRRRYSEDDFDYFALYLPQVDKVVYPAIQFAGAKITCKVGRSATPFYWYEDFLEPTVQAEKRNYTEFGVKIGSPGTSKQHKCLWPCSDELQKLLWEMPTVQIAKHYGVSDVAVAKWAKKYGLKKPERGYWAKQQRPVSK